MKKRILTVLLCSAVLMTCVSCGPEGEGSQSSSGSGPAENRSNLELNQNQKRADCAGIWVYENQDPEGEPARIRLILDKDKRAQYLELDRDDMVLSVSDGTWSADKGKLTLNLETVLENGMEPDQPRPSGGVYQMRRKKDAMTLTASENAAHLSGQKTLSFVLQPEVTEHWEDLPQSLVETWICDIVEQGEERVYRLTLFDSGEAQLPVQTGIGDLLDLYIGTWRVEKPGVLRLELHNEEEKTITGSVPYELAESGLLVLTGTKENEELPFLMDGETAVLESSAAKFNREERDWMLCSTVLNYYEAVTEHEYPGYAQVDSWDGQGNFTIHLYEDMGDHTATAGWYTINVETMLGTDDMTGESIDFNPYSGERGVG